MRIIYYTYPAFFDASLCMIRSLSKKVELYVILEVTPESRQGTILDLTSVPLVPGITPADPLLAPLLPEKIREYWKDVGGFYIATFNHPKSIQPETIRHGKIITDFMRELRPDIILFDDISLRIALVSFFLQDILWVVGVHDPDPHSGEKDWRTTLARKLMYSNVKQFVIHNQYQASNFINKNRISPTRSSVIRLGVYDVYRNWNHLNSQSEERNILFFGRLAPYKGVQVLLEAASKVCEQLEDVTINIVGKPIPGYSLPSLSVLPNGGRINLVKQYVSPGDLVQFFNKAVCVICPYIDATQSGVVLTAYAFDRPVIASRVGGLPEYVLDGHTGLLIEPNDSQALADAILLMLQNNELRRNLQQGCSDVQQEYISWERISNQYIHIFRNLTQDG